MNARLHENEIKRDMGSLLKIYTWYIELNYRQLNIILLYTLTLPSGYKFDKNDDKCWVKA